MKAINDVAEARATALSLHSLLSTAIDTMSTVVYTSRMFTVLRTDEFKAWSAGLRDLKALARIDARIRRAEMGNLGDVKSVGGGVGEMRIDYGPGYRLYFTRRGLELIVLLCGGDKRTQTADIKRAQKMVAELED